MRLYFFLLISVFFSSNFAAANINACLPAIKNKMQKGDFAFALGFGEVDSRFIEINSLLEKSPKMEGKYTASFNKISEIQKGQVIDISYQYELQLPNNNDQINRITYSLEKDGTFKIEYKIKYKIDDKYYPITSLTQFFYFKEDCSLHVSFVEMEDYKTLDTGDVKLTEYRFYKDKTLASKEMTLPWEHYKNSCNTVMDIENATDLMRYAGTRNLCFMEPDFYSIDIYISRKIEEKNNIKFDLFLNKKAQFSKVDVFFDDNKIAQIYASDESDCIYFRNHKNIILSEITENNWEKINLFTEENEEKNSEIKLTGSCFNETFFASDNARYSLLAKQPLQHNLAHYFNSISYDGFFGGKYNYSVVGKSDFSVKDLETLPLISQVHEEDLPYIQATDYIDPQNERIKELLLFHIPHPEQITRLQAVKTILYLVNKLLSFDRRILLDHVVSAEILKTEDILQRKQGVCQNYAALFVAFARSLGIPARLIGGVHYDNFQVREKNTEHAWVEVNLNNRDWTPLEPQRSSLSPLPANGYIPSSISFFYERGNPLIEQREMMQKMLKSSHVFEVQYCPEEKMGH